MIVISSGVRLAALAAASGLALMSMAAPVQAQSGAAIAAPVSADVSAFYQRFRQPIWFKPGADQSAIPQMVSILQRSAFDGLVSGPALAAQVQAAAAQAAASPANALAADQIVSNAWVAYVQRMKQPTPGMTYAIPFLAPKNTRADQILLTASAAPSLSAYMNGIANPNLLYDQLRDTAWRQAQNGGNPAPDPRLIANLDRVRSIPATGRFMVVDSGSQLLTMYENGRPVDSMRVVAGKPELPTPMIASIMYYMVYNPYWNVPDHLIRKVTAPNFLKQGVAYLNRQGYQVMADWTADSAVVSPSDVDWKAVVAGKEHIRIRQKPGAANSMGKLKFPFPNGLDIFLHDSPEREYFDRNSRTLSNGCVRLQDARRLARWLLGTEPSAPSDDAETQVKLPQGVPIYLTYITAQAQNGQLVYLDDPYGWDRPAQARVASSK
jgi:murein L,D-transpeptidase YcbB/YkuD